MINLKKILMLAICLCLMSPTFTVLATEKTDTTDDTDITETNTSGSADSDEDGDGNSDDDDDSDDSNSQLNISPKVMLCDNWETPTAVHGQTVSVVLPLVNMDNYDVYDVIVTPQIATDTESFPFEIEKSSYTQTVDSLPGAASIGDPYDRRREITYTFKTRKDVKTGYYRVAFDVLFTNVEGISDSTNIELYVKTVGLTGSDSESGSVPRVIVTGFTTDPETVKAGEDFNLTIHLKNTSKTTQVRNLKVDLEAVTEGSDENTTYQAFLPTEGSSTLYVNSISPDSTQDISISMNAKADLTQKPYVLNVKMEYEDVSNTQYTSDSDVSIPVHQEARFDVSEPEVMPASIAIGSESNVMFNIYNTGKTKLYNVSVSFEAESISGGDTFVGNIEAGGTGNVDAMITGAQVTTDDGTVKITIKYEDEAGKVNTLENTMNLSVMEEMNDIWEDDPIFDEEEIDNKSSFSLGKLVIVIIVIIAVVAAVVVGLNILKKKKDKKNENDLLSEIDDDYIDEDIMIDSQQDVDDVKEEDSKNKGVDDEI